MTTLTAYFDDSGDYGGTPTTTVAGFVSSVDQWLLFERDWQAILQMPQFDLEYLHMKELRTGKGRFAKFKDNLPLQRELFDRAQRLLRVRVLETFGGSVIHADYDEVNREYQVAETLGSPILMAAHLAIMKLMRWKERVRPNDSLELSLTKALKTGAFWTTAPSRHLDADSFRPSFPRPPRCRRETWPHGSYIVGLLTHWHPPASVSADLLWRFLTDSER